MALRLRPHRSLSDCFPLSTGVWSADGELLRVTLASDDQYRLWTPLSEISPTVVEAFLLKEDRWFYWHPGVNPVSLARAGFETYRGVGHQGGSTLTMQVVRTTMPTAGRSNCRWSSAVLNICSLCHTRRRISLMPYFAADSIGLGGSTRRLIPACSALPSARSSAIWLNMAIAASTTSQH